MRKRDKAAFLVFAAAVSVFGAFNGLLPSISYNQPNERSDCATEQIIRFPLRPFPPRLRSARFYLESQDLSHTPPTHTFMKNKMNFTLRKYFAREDSSPRGCESLAAAVGIAGLIWESRNLHTGKCALYGTLFYRSDDGSGLSCGSQLVINLTTVPLILYLARAAGKEGKFGRHSGCGSK